MAKKDTKKKGAMGTDPSLPELTKRGNWKFNGRWVNKEGFLVDGYGKVLPNQKAPFVAAAKNPFVKKETTPTNPGKNPKAPPKVEERINTNLNKLVEKGSEDARNFNPDTFVQEYNPQFDQTIQQSYDRIYGQFDRKNQELFARQNEQLQQNLVERGLDPNSPAYQALTKQLADQQSRATQDAQDAAWNTAASYQQQRFNQASTSALLPGQVAQPYLNIYGQNQQQQFTGTEADKQRQWLEQQAKLDREQKERLAKRTGGGGANNTGADVAAYIMNQYGSGAPTQPSGVNTGIQAVGAGFGNALNNSLLKQG